MFLPPRPQTPLYARDDLEKALKARRIGPEVASFIRTLASDGGALIDLGETGRRLCDQVVAETDAYFDDPAVSRVQDAWLASPAVRRLAALPRIRRFLRAAYGRAPFPFQTLNFKRGSGQPLHSDTIHFNSAPVGFMCGVWIALEDIAPGAGPLEYRLGSHRLSELTMQDVGVNRATPEPRDYHSHYEPAVRRRVEEAGLPASTLLLRKGQAFVWTANLVHGGSPVTDPNSTRRSLVVHFYFEGCDYYTPMLSNLAAGIVHRRLPADIRSGRLVWPRIDGRRAALDPEMVRNVQAARRQARPIPS